MNELMNEWRTDSQFLKTHLSSTISGEPNICLLLESVSKPLQPQSPNSLAIPEAAHHQGSAPPLARFTNGAQKTPAPAASLLLIGSAAVLPAPLTASHARCIVGLVVYS